MSWYAKLFMCFFLLMGVACSDAGTALTGDDDDDDDDDVVVSTDTLATAIESGADSLVLNVSASDVAASISSTGFQAALSGTSEQWDQYFGEYTYNLLTDVFGPADEDPRVVTKLRVQIEGLFEYVDQIMSVDPEVDCTATGERSAAINPFTDGDTDTIELPFFGDVENGASGDRRFECIFSDSDETFLYGLTSDGVFSFAMFSDVTDVNEESVEERGDEQRLAQVTFVTYAQSGDGFLDLQYAQASLYNGPDLVFALEDVASTDDVIFKSRSRITGTFSVDEEGNATGGAGEFFVTKYDVSATPEGDPIVTETQTHGRGGYGAEELSIFDIATTADQVTDANGSFCLQQPTSGTVPTLADAEDCSTLETDFAWGATTFPFDLAPALDQVFADASFFADADAGLIENDLSNFTLPAYAATE